MTSQWLQLDTSVWLPDEGPLQMAARVFIPEQPKPWVMVCLAGGNMNGRYFDLRTEDGELSYSFAAAMMARGFVVVTLDYLGLGQSSKPRDGHALTPAVLTQANANVTKELLARLRDGRLGPGLPTLRSIGVGHSMGGMMTVLQQQAAQQHAALVLLGFATRGLPHFLPSEVRALSQAEQRAGLVEFARRMFPQPYPVIKSSGNGAEVYGSAKAEPRGIAALKSATDCLLPVPAFMSLLPGNVAPEAAQIEVPVYLGVGEKDMTGSPQDIAPAFPRSPSIHLEVLPDTGHSHFLFATRQQLFDGIANWVQCL